MSKAEVVERLAALSALSRLPHDELEWLVAHGELALFGKGTAIARKGDPMDRMMIVLSGHIPIHQDRGTGLRWVVDWRPGDVTGVLPYSRASISMTDIHLDEETELLTVRADHLPEMIRQCPAFTTHVVHVMLDRTRSFNTSDQQEEKAISLGKLAAGLAHELNNPASATVRAAKLLVAVLPDADAAVRGLGGAALTKGQLEAIERLREVCLGPRWVGSPRGARFTRSPSTSVGPRPGSTSWWTPSSDSRTWTTSAHLRS